MKHTIISSARKRRAAALERELDDAAAAVKKNGDDAAAAVARIPDLRAALAATRDESDDYACHRCGVAIAADDPRAGGMHFTRMSRHDGSDRIVATTSAEFKYCSDCYTVEHAAVLGMSVEHTRESAKGRGNGTGKPRNSV